jgi:hypothetical protein
MLAALTQFMKYLTDPLAKAIKASHGARLKAPIERIPLLPFDGPNL